MKRVCVVIEWVAKETTSKYSRLLYRVFPDILQKTQIHISFNLVLMIAMRAHVCDMWKNADIKTRGGYRLKRNTSIFQTGSSADKILTFLSQTKT